MLPLPLLLLLFLFRWRDTKELGGVAIMHACSTHMWRPTSTRKHLFSEEWALPPPQESTTTDPTEPPLEGEGVRTGQGEKASTCGGSDYINIRIDTHTQYTECHNVISLVYTCSQDFKICTHVYTHTHTYSHWPKLKSAKSSKTFPASLKPKLL